MQIKGIDLERYWQGLQETGQRQISSVVFVEID